MPLIKISKEKLRKMNKKYKSTNPFIAQLKEFESLKNP